MWGPVRSGGTGVDSRLERVRALAVWRGGRGAEPKGRRPPALPPSCTFQGH